MSDTFVRLFSGLYSHGPAAGMGVVILVILFAPALFYMFLFLPAYKGKRESITSVTSPVSITGWPFEKCHFAITKVSPFPNFIFHFDE